jgi:hypothetical protein
VDRFARRVFTLAAVYGLVVLVPQYFMEERIGRDAPPPITHPELFYGFLGVAIAWQLCFLVVARDPTRFRPVMVPAIVEKLAFGLPAIVLYSQRRISGAVLFFGAIDLLLATLFFISSRRTAASAR